MPFFGVIHGQDLAYNENPVLPFQNARKKALLGDHKAARTTLDQLLTDDPDNMDARILLARTLSWDGKYQEARKEFNKVTSVERNNRGVWVSAVKNELYLKNGATALGLANKALLYIKEDPELLRLRQRAMELIENQVYPPWNEDPGEGLTLKKAKKKKKNKKKSAEVAESTEETKEVAKEAKEKKGPKNMFSVNNGFTVFNDFYDPMIRASVEYKRQTLAGSIIPRINYSNQFETNGLQYDIDFYPKFSKRFYAYMNYGFSNASIFPNHKVGGDLYVNLPWAMEFSAGGRFLSFDAREISIITNSVGYYKGNYYFSLRSYITPRSDNLTRFSGNLLVRRYLKDAENYIGVSAGMGLSPELRQIVLDNTVLSETLFYLESQRVNMEYQFTAKGTPNIYKAQLSFARQELFAEPGNFIFSVGAGFIYKVKF